MLPTQVPHLFILPCGKIPPNPSELLGSERMAEFLARAREQFGRVILDSPPLMSVTDAAVLSTQVEGVLLVVKAETVPRRVALEARDHLLELHAPLLGVVLNKVPVQRDGYYYNYYYRYHSYYTSGDAGHTRRPRTSQTPAGLLGPDENRPPQSEDEDPGVVGEGEALAGGS